MLHAPSTRAMHAAMVSVHWVAMALNSELHMGYWFEAELHGDYLYEGCHVCLARIFRNPYWEHKLTVLLVASDK